MVAPPVHDDDIYDEEGCPPPVQDNEIEEID
jgi:hypothetical protein